MSQQSREPANAESNDRPTEGATGPRGDTSDMTAFLFSQLPPHPPGQPVTPLRYVPVASRAWSFVNRYYPPNKLEPPDASTYCCDRCQPGAAPVTVRGVEATPMSRHSREPPASSAPTEGRAGRVTPGTTPYYCDRCKPRATPAEARRADPTPMAREFCALPVSLESPEVRPDVATGQPEDPSPWFDPLPYLLPGRIAPDGPLRYITVARRASPFLIRYIKGAPRPKRWHWCGIPQA
jgi:hypothetical protein